MFPEHLLVGALFFVLCLFLLLKSRWFLENTPKGQALVRTLGPVTASLALKSLTIVGMIVAALVAGGVIRPMKW